MRFEPHQLPYLGQTVAGTEENYPEDDLARTDGPYEQGFARQSRRNTMPMECYLTSTRWSTDCLATRTGGMVQGLLLSRRVRAEEPHEDDAGVHELVPEWYPFARFIVGPPPYQNRIVGKRVPLL